MLATLRRRTFPGFPTAALVLSVLVVLFGFLPLLSVLGYETSVLLSCGLFLCAAGWGVDAVRRLPPAGVGALKELRGTPWRDLNRALALRWRGGLVLACIPVALLAVRQAFLDGCRVHPGLFLYAILTLPALLLGLGAGALGATLMKRRAAVVLFVGFFALCTAALSLAEGMRGPRAVLHNLVIGTVSLSGYTGYDETLSIPGVLLRQRLFVLVLGAGLVALSGWILAGRRRRRVEEGEGEVPHAAHRERLVRELERDRRRYRRAGLAVLLCLVPFLLAPDASGLGSGTRRLERHLSRVVEAPNVRVHHAPAGPASAVAERVAWEAEWWVRDLSLRLGIPPGPVDIWLYDDADQQAALTGARGFLFAKPWRRALHVQVAGGTVRSLDHELVHVLAATFGPPPFAASWLPGLTEGLAVALEEGMDRFPEAHGQAAAALRAGHLPRGREFLGLLGFGSSGMRRSYAAAGSFCGWLLLSRGPEPMHHAYRTGDLEGAYGQAVADLEREWRAFLRQVPADPEERDRARLRFDPAINPAFFTRSCPRVGRRDRDRALLEGANRAWSQGNPHRAAELYLHWAARDPERRVRALLWSGQILSQTLDPLGMALLDLVADQEGAGARLAGESLYREAVHHRHQELAIESVDRLAEKGYLSPGEAAFHRELARRPVPPGPPRGTDRPGSEALLAWLSPLGPGGGMGLAEGREAVERLALAAPERLALIEAFLEDLVRREVTEGRLGEAIRYLVLLRDLPAAERVRHRREAWLERLRFMKQGIGAASASRLSDSGSNRRSGGAFAGAWSAFVDPLPLQCPCT